MNPDNNVTKSSNKTTLILVLIFIAVCLFTIYSYSKLKTLEGGSQQANNNRVAEVVGKLSKLIDLPTNEVPSVATIADMTPLKNNPFFAKAKVGDEVIFYTNSQTVYLYDPEQNKIVEVATLNLK